MGRPKRPRMLRWRCSSKPNSRCFQNLHKSGAEKKYLGYKRFEILYLQNGIAFTLLCYIFQKPSIYSSLKTLKAAVFLLKHVAGWNRFLFVFNRLIDFGSIIILSVCSRNETFFFSIKLTERLQNTRPTNRTVKRTATAVRGPVVDECKFYLNSKEYKNGLPPGSVVT